MDRRYLLALLAAAATGVQVGAAMVATRFVVGAIGPGSLALLRYAIAVLCLLPFFLRQPKTRFTPRDLLAVMELGIGQFGILIALLNLGLRYMPATRAALLFTTFPLLTMLVAAALGQERLTVAKSTGVVLTILGVAAVLGEKLLVGGSPQEWLGAALVLGAALCGALCSAAYRPYLRRYPTLPVGFWAMLASVGGLSLLAATEGFFTTPPPLRPGFWAAVLFIGVSSGIGYTLWLWALKYASPTHATLFLALSPVVAALLGVIALGEAFTWGLGLGLLGVTGGLFVATRAPRPAPNAAPPRPTTS